LPHDEQKCVPMVRSWQLQQTSGGFAMGSGELIRLKNSLKSLQT